MRTIRSHLYQDENSCSFTTVPDNSGYMSENLTESVIDMRLGELATKLFDAKSAKSNASEDDFLNVSQAFSDFSARWRKPSKRAGTGAGAVFGVPPKGKLLDRNNRKHFAGRSSTYGQDLRRRSSILINRHQAISRSKLRLLAKNRSDNRVLIGESGAIPALIPLLKCSDPWTQEHSVTALLNLSLHENNKSIITNAGAIKSLVYVLKTGTETSKQNAACALLSLALIEENKSSIGACGAIPPLVSLLISGSNRGKKDSLTTLYKLCSLKQNKERAVSAGAVRPLVAMLVGQGEGMAEKAMVVLSLLAAIAEGRDAIVDENGIAALVEAIEDGSVKGKEFAVLTLLQLCAESVRNRGLLVREGGIPPLVALSQTGSVRAKHKAETLLGYLREPRQEASSSSP
ncbi:hypothetical protein Patl1_09704 [Pistacia atlantica]|uniref:Uncharacterized protein n=1 Tax=Pistacia atlantica TaxID=434234 RepID=A0ACC1A7S1_9ROSI|nr:hypothetical protein Patl1_09704 [Pistacia atlantica]